MDCYSATQGTELDPQFKGDWITRALGVACTIDEVVPRWIEVIPRRDDDGDNKTWVMGPVMKVRDVPKDFSFDYRNDPIPGANDPRSELRIRDLHDGEKRRYDDIDGLREALQPGDWPMRNVVSVNLGRATPSAELTKFITEELGSLAPKLEYLDISGLTHPSFGDEQLTTMVASMQRLRVLLMPHEFGPSFKDMSFTLGSNTSGSAESARTYRKTSTRYFATARRSSVWTSPRSVRTREDEKARETRGRRFGTRRYFGNRAEAGYRPSRTGGRRRSPCGPTRCTPPWGCSRGRCWRTRTIRIVSSTRSTMRSGRSTSRRTSIDTGDVTTAIQLKWVTMSEYSFLSL